MMNYLPLELQNELVHEQERRNRCMAKVELGPMGTPCQAEVSCCRPKSSLTLSVKFNLQKTTIHHYQEYEVVDDEDAFFSSFTRKRSEEVTFRAETDRNILAFRQELLDTTGGYDSLSRYGSGSGSLARTLQTEHLISSISIRKNLAQQLARRQVIRAVLDEQARQRRCHHFDPELIALKSMEQSRASVVRARMLCEFTSNESRRDTYPSKTGH